jgi:glycosyltransferase involved in cell wall biosynthesis
MNTADALVGAGHRVVIWSAAFSHQERRHRSRSVQHLKLSDRLEYHLIPSPGYERNVGVPRLWDHARLALNLRRALRTSQPPDACVVGFPPIETAAVMARWLEERGVPCLIDVKDQWPIPFLDAFPGALRAPARALLDPYYRLARRALRSATALSAMSESFLRWAIEFSDRTRGPADLVVHFASRPPRLSDADIEKAGKGWDDLGVLATGANFCFVGTHTSSFDFRSVLDGAAALARSHPAAQIVMCGDGEDTTAWQRQAAQLKNVLFPGRIDQAQFRVLGERCSAFIAPYRNVRGFDISIPNKIVDAMSMGLPVVAPLRGEVEALIAKDGVGLTYSEGSGASLHERLARLLDDEPSRLKMKAAATRVYETRFTYEKVYGKLVEHLEALATGRLGSAARPA